jgi:hypothetical protein
VISAVDLKHVLKHVAGTIDLAGKVVPGNKGDQGARHVRPHLPGRLGLRLRQRALNPLSGLDDA